MIFTNKLTMAELEKEHVLRNIVDLARIDRKNIKHGFVYILPFIFANKKNQAIRGGIQTVMIAITRHRM